jgi:hypothetical protein
MPDIILELDGVGIEAETLEGITIQYGRQRTTELVEPSAASITILTPAQPWPWSIGSTVTIDAEISAVTYRRFTGVITQIDAGLYTTTFQCTSAGLGACAAAQANEYVITAWKPPIPVIDLEEVFTRAGLLGGSGPTFTTSLQLGDTTPYAPFTLPQGSVLEQIQKIAATNIQGLIWEEQDGTVRFTSVGGRYTTTPFVTLEADSVSQSWTASATVASIINRVELTYNDGAGTILMEDAASQTTHGVRGYSEEFAVVDVDDATVRASKILAGYGTPSWITNPITVELTAIGSSTVLTKMLQLQVGTPVSLQEINDVIDVVPVKAFVEGYTERIYQNYWRMELYFSDARLTIRPEQWSTVTASLIWSSVDPTLTWYQATEASL